MTVKSAYVVSENHHRLTVIKRIHSPYFSVGYLVAAYFLYEAVTLLQSPLNIGALILIEMILLSGAILFLLFARRGIENKLTFQTDSERLIYQAGLFGGILPRSVSPLTTNRGLYLPAVYWFRQIQDLKIIHEKDALQIFLVMNGERVVQMKAPQSHTGTSYIPLYEGSDLAEASEIIRKIDMKLQLRLMDQLDKKIKSAHA